jgi:hypothetical protein
VNVALHVLAPSQLLVAVKVTVLEPPQASGAPLLLLLMPVLHPPLALAVASHAANAASTSVCDRLADIVVFWAQVNTTGGAFVTWNVALHVFGDSQELVTVKVTVFEPPQAFGASPPLLVTGPRLQPPVADAVASHAV